MKKVEAHISNANHQLFDALGRQMGTSIEDANIFLCVLPMIFGGQNV
jgi:hypothetical protein